MPPSTSADVVATLDPEVIRKMERMQHLIGQLRSQVTDQVGRRVGPGCALR